jgi:hypothetical protein
MGLVGEDLLRLTKSLFNHEVAEGGLTQLGRARNDVFLQRSRPSSRRGDGKPPRLPAEKPQRAARAQRQ